MAYLLVESFSQGLDTRRSVLTSKPGTLQICKNAHITRGGEIEKRKAFAPRFELPLGTFGLQAAKNNLYVFGSIAAPAMPSGIAYQRLAHPAAANMSELVYSENFNGKVYAIARFDDGSLYHYYDGVRVTAWDSIASAAGDNDGIAVAFANQIDLMAEFSATAAGAVVTITAAAVNTPFTPTAATVDGGSYTNDIVGQQLVWDGTYYHDPNFGKQKHYVWQNIYANVWHPNNNQSITLVKTVAAGVGTAEVWTATIGGTFQVADQFSLHIVNGGGFDRVFGVYASASGVGSVAKTHKLKMYSVARSLLYFSEINNPTKFNTNVNGSGFINLSNQDSGSEDLTALAVYQGKLAVFSRSTIQTWAMDPDPAKNAQVQVLDNIGTRAPRSVVNFGDIDVFFLADSGIRSVRARDASNSSTVSDIGVNIDSLVTEDLRTIDEVFQVQAAGIIEPKDGRYLLALGDKVYVYSYFPTPQIAAWSVYEPGFVISHFAKSFGKVYCRSGNNVYVYGGESGNDYDDCDVDIFLPFLDAGKPAHFKQLEAYDLGAEGPWTAYAGLDTSNMDALDLLGYTQDSTWDIQKMAAVGQGTHIAMRFKNKAPGYARISNVAIHYSTGESDK